jgi:curved DNA-binding protein CbpA
MTGTADPMDPGREKAPDIGPSAGLDPYEVLGVARGASDQTIAAAHKQLAREFHPDIAGEVATVRMMQINAAFDTIRTSERRVLFDEFGPRPTGARDRSAASGSSGVPRWTPERDGTGGAGPAPGRPSGSVLPFGRHIGWSLGEIARVDPGYLEWLAGQRDGRRYADEIDVILRRAGYRSDGEDPDTGR